MGRPRGGEATTRWVIFKGELRHVDTFLRLSPELRKGASCPGCGQEVTIRATSNITPNAAHKVPNPDCGATAPESERHYRTKQHIARELRKNMGGKLRLRERCVNRRDYLDGSAVRCTKTQERDWVEGWDEVRVEWSNGERQPDIALMKEERILAVIEVCATHAIEEAKKEYFERRRWPWIEVRASEDIYNDEEDRTPWSYEKPLPFARIGPEPSSWECEGCKPTLRIVKPPPPRQLRNFKIFHCFLPNGRWFRDAFMVIEHLRDGVVHRVELTRALRRGAIAEEFAPISPESIERLSEAFHATYQGWWEEHGAFIDSPMGWARGGPVDGLIDEVDCERGRLPKRWWFDAKAKRWLRVEDFHDVTWFEAIAGVDCAREASG